MTDESFDISRRKILAGMSAVGVAGATAGVGTSAYFSDEESFANNTLTAGELDLKVDWEEHYSDWSDDEDDDPESDGSLDIRMELGEADPNEYKPFPPGVSEFDGENSEPLLYVHNDDVDQFMANTAMEAFPDMDNDGLAEFPIDEIAGEPCDFLADVGGEEGDDLGSYTDPNADDLGRTDNDDTRDGDGDPTPLINLSDVKPGDFGEVTLSTHLCNNPGYLWMNMPDGLRMSENGLTEPEMKDPDEDQTFNETSEQIEPKDGVQDPVVELADELQTAIWYDNDCDNLVTCEEKLDLIAVVDTSNSMDSVLGDTIQGGNLFVDTLETFFTDPSNVRAGLLTFNGPDDADENPDNPAGVFDRPALRAGLGPLDQFDTDPNDGADLEEFIPDTGNGGTPTPHALDLAAQVLHTDPDARPDARKVIVLITDGLPDYNEYENNPTIPYGVEAGEGSPLSTGPETYEQLDDYEGGGATGVITQEEKDETAELSNDIQTTGRTAARSPPDIQGDIEVVVGGIDLGTEGKNLLRDRVAGQNGAGSAELEYFFDLGADPTEAIPMAQFVAQGPGKCEEIIFQGSLREAATELMANEGRGIPLTSNQTTGYDELEDDEISEDRWCYDPGMTACFGFSWWLPVDHANEIQSDVAEFDLGFYTEQCRHNDGSGMVL